MTMLIKTQAGDSSIGLDNGQTSIPTSGTPNVIRITPQTITANSSVSPAGEPSASTYDVIIYGSNILVAKVISFSFLCTLKALNSNTGIPIVYVKLIGALSASGAGYDLVAPMTPGQIFTWINPANADNVQPSAATDPNGIAMTIGANQQILVPKALVTGPILRISVTPDKISDVYVSGTVELTV